MSYTHTRDYHLYTIGKFCSFDVYLSRAQYKSEKEVFESRLFYMGAGLKCPDGDALHKGADFSRQQPDSSLSLTRDGGVLIERGLALLWTAISHVEIASLQQHTDCDYNILLLSRPRARPSKTSPQ